MEKLKELYQKYNEIILYGVFGGLTTIVNWIVTFALKWKFNIDAQDPKFIIVNAVAWACAVAFAYVTSHIFVFESKAKGFVPICEEAAKFVGSRIFTGIIESLLPNGLTAIGLTGPSFLEGFWAKAITGVIVIILNYVLSKLFVFRKAKNEPAPESLLHGAGIEFEETEE